MQHRVRLPSTVLMKQNDGIDKPHRSTNIDYKSNRQGDDGVDIGDGNGNGGAIRIEDGSGEEEPPVVIKPDLDNTTQEENITKRSKGQRLTNDLRAENDANVRNMFKIIDSGGWKHVVTVDGEHPATVWKKTIQPGTYIPSDAADDGKAAKFSCIKATAIIEAPPQEVYKLFLDNVRVHEYNEHCAELEDVEHLSKDTKISWSATKPFGPVKGRDFLTVVHHRKLPDGTRIVVNRPAIHPDRPSGKKFQRAEVLLAGNVMKPVKGHPRKTELTVITHVNPGGIVDNPIGAAAINRLTSRSPIEYIEKLEAAARKTNGPAVGPYQAMDLTAATEAIRHHLNEQRAAAESVAQRAADRCRQAAAHLFPPGGR